MREDFLPAHGGQLRELAAEFGVPEASLLDFSASIHRIRHRIVLLTLYAPPSARARF